MILFEEITFILLFQNYHNTAFILHFDVMITAFIFVLAMAPFACGSWSLRPPRLPLPLPSLGRAAGLGCSSAFPAKWRQVPNIAPISAVPTSFTTTSLTKQRQESGGGGGGGWDLGIDLQELFHTLAASWWGDHAPAPTTRRYALSRLPWIIDYHFYNATEKGMILGRSDRRILKLNEDYSVTVQRPRSATSLRSLFESWPKILSRQTNASSASKSGPLGGRLPSPAAAWWTGRQGTWAYSDLGGDRGLLRVDVAVRSPDEHPDGSNILTPCVLRHEVVIRGPNDPATYPLAVVPCLGRVHRRPSLLPAWTAPLCRAGLQCLGSWLPLGLRSRDVRAQSDIGTFAMRLSAAGPKITNSDVL